MEPRQQIQRNWKISFFTVWTGQAFSLLGSEVVQFALVWWLTSKTGSATTLAIASMMAFLPQVFLSPFAGALVDRWDRRTVMMVADGVIALATSALAVLFALGAVQVWHIYLLMLVRSMGGSFQWPAMQASTSLMVPDQHLARIAGLNQALFGVAGIVAPPLGALLLETLSTQSALAIDVGTAALAIAPLFFVHIPQPMRRVPAQARPSLLADMREGWRFIWGWPGMVGLIGLALVVKIALTPAFSLIPLLVRDHFSGGAAQLSLLEAVSGVGAVIGGLALGVWGGFQKKIRTSMMGIILMGLGLLALGLIPSGLFWMALVSVFLIGLVIPLTDAPIMAIVQGTVAPEMQARVFTLMGSLLSLTSPLSLAIAGPVADRLGLQAWYVMAGGLCLLAGLAGFLIPAIMNIEENASGSSTEKQQIAVAQAEAP